MAKKSEGSLFWWMVFRFENISVCCFSPNKTDEIFFLKSWSEIWLWLFVYLPLKKHLVLYLNDFHCCFGIFLFYIWSHWRFAWDVDKYTSFHAEREGRESKLAEILSCLEWARKLFIKELRRNSRFLSVPGRL